MSYAATPADIRFLRKVLIGDGCWEWQGKLGKPHGRNSGGYGWLFLRKVQGRTVLVSAHRFAYESFVGPIPDGLQVIGAYA